MSAVSPRIVAPRFHHVWGGVSQRVFVLDPRRLWTAEEGGRIRYSSDGGTTWQFQTTPDAIDGYVRGIHFMRSGAQAGQLGWAAGSNGRLIVTTNGGQNWTLVGPELVYPADDPLAGQPVDIWDVYFQDALNGWIAGIRLLRRTSDGGATWIDLLEHNPTLPSSAEFYRFAFQAQGPGFFGVAVAEPGLIVRTEDGTSWAAVLQVPDFCPTLPDGLEMWDVQFHPSTPAIGYAVGGQGNQCGGLLATTDGGLTWTRETTAALPPTVYGVAPLANGAAIACGYGGRAYLRRPLLDPAWLDISGRLEPPARDARVPIWGAGSDGNATAWIVGVMNMVYKTSSSGSSWIRQRGAGAWRMRDVHFVDALQGWAVAQGLVVLHSLDGGVNWTEDLHASNTPNLNVVRFRGAGNGFVVGNAPPGGAPVIFYYDTAQLPVGWRPSSIATPPAPPPTNAALLSATWASFAGNDAWAVGTKGVVMRSTDGAAQSWAYFPGPAGTADVDFLSIAFDGVDALYAVGTHRSTGVASAFRMRYPALSWEDLSPGLLGTWRAVAAQGSDVYVAGSSSPTEGVVYKLDSSAPGIPTWNQVYPATGQNSPQVLMCAALTGSGANRMFIAGGERGAILRFQNSAWATLKSQTSVTLTGLSFLSPSRGYAVGHGSVDGQGTGGGSGLGDSAMVGYS
ncbi:MAG TPA: hypothetical protein VK843_13865 [Planctomycetota bacterium]|nr:hypothetical protein [Planctomycetota bacterium]